MRKRLRDKPAPSYLQDFIYGSGPAVTFAVVAGGEDASLDETVVILLGGAKPLADGFSMAVSNFFGSLRLSSDERTISLAGEHDSRRGLRPAPPPAHRTRSAPASWDSVKSESPADGYA